MSQIICFIGIDGSGKTTLCRELVKELRSRGIPSRYVYGRFLPKMMAPVFKIISKLTLDDNNTHKYHNTRLKNQRRLLSNPLISRIFIGGVLLDQIFQVLLKIYLPSKFRKEVVICDRYFHDTAVIDIAVPCEFSDNDTVRFVQRYLPLFPKINMLFLVVVPPSIAFQRKKDILSIKVLERLSDTYLHTARHFGVTTIDGTRDLSELTSVLLSKLELSGLSKSGMSVRNV